MKINEHNSVLSIIALSLLVFIVMSFSTKQGENKAYRYHSISELSLLGLDDLPLDTNTLFAASGNCVLCHGDPSQYPSSSANLDSLGNDVSPVSYWQATMMANSSKDPFWRAKVKHESLENPDLADEVQTLCTTCHAPNGHFNAIHNGEVLYTIADLEDDPMGLDGVSCTSCHSMEDIDMGITFSGDISYNTNHEVYGPYTDPFPMPMINHIGFTPLYSSHISSSEACGKCHSLITQTINEDGELLDNFFPEQSVYHEWLNSAYAQDDISCVSCHMSNTNESIKVSPMPPWLDPRSPFLTHDLVGGNVFMLNVLKNNSEDLDLNASAEQFDEVIDRSLVMLQERAIEIEVLPLEITEDSITFKLQLENKSGHKLPSGYPSRKVMIEFLARSLDGDTLFHSGGFNGDSRIRGESDTGYEPHYNKIYSEDQVQIYEYVMADEAQEVTTILTRAFNGIKDNRIPPLGFVSSHQSYDTTMVIGEATNDPNFNIENDLEGSGIDYIDYTIPFLDNPDGLLITIRIHYIAVPRKWLDQLFENDAEEITDFHSMYDEIEEPSVIMKELEFIAGYNFIEEVDHSMLSVYPNPNLGEVKINSNEKRISSVKVIDSRGKTILQKMDYNTLHVVLNLPEAAGNYLIIIELENGKKVSRSILRL